MYVKRLVSMAPDSGNAQQINEDGSQLHFQETLIYATLDEICFASSHNPKV